MVSISLKVNEWLKMARLGDESHKEKPILILCYVGNIIYDLGNETVTSSKNYRLTKNDKHQIVGTVQKRLPIK